MLKTSKPLPMLRDAILNMTEIASHLFREENLEIAVHGNKDKFPMIQLKLELLLNAIKNENSRYTSKSNDLIALPDFTNQTLYKNFFKTPLQVNMCAESMQGPTIANEDEFAAMLIF